MKTGKAAALAKPNQLESWDIAVPEPVAGGLLAVKSGSAVKAVIGPSLG